MKSTYKRQWHLLSAVILTLFTISSASAELGRVKVATQIGLSYLPLVIMQRDKLWEENAKGLGVPLEVEYVQLGGGAPLNDAILSDSVQVAAAGLAPMLILWDRTRTSAKVKGISAINGGPMYLLTNKDQIRSWPISRTPMVSLCRA